MKLFKKITNLFDYIKRYWNELPEQDTFENSLERLQSLSKHKQFLEDKIEVQNKVIKLMQKENEIQSTLLEEYRSYAPTNNQAREGKKYKGNLINLSSKQDKGYYTYE